MLWECNAAESYERICAGDVGVGWGDGDFAQRNLSDWIVHRTAIDLLLLF